MTESYDHYINFLSVFYSENAGFDVLEHDFRDVSVLDGVDIGDEPAESALEILKLSRRIQSLTSDADVVGVLLRGGWHSAHAVAGVPKPVFVQGLKREGIEDKIAENLHDKAVSTKSAAQHVLANVVSLVGDRYFRTSRAFTGTSSLDEVAQSIPSYQDLFGNLNFLKCTHCQSIFGPSAYFLDLMRIVNDYVISPNTNKADNNIPDAYLLRTRRPDLYELDLTCENTDQLVPYLEVVNRVLERHIGQTPYHTLAAAPYPFNLPFNLPLIEMRNNLEGMKASLAEVYTLLDTKDEVGNQAALKAVELQIAREYIGLSIEQLAVVSHPETTAEGLGPYYGYTSLTPASLIGLSHVSTFLKRSGLSRSQLTALLYQETSVDERTKVAPDFFINDTKEQNTPPFMSLVFDKSDPDNVVERIDGLTLLRADRINRFVRLQAVLDWPYASLQWAMQSVGETEIEGCISPFAGIKRLQTGTGLSVDDLAGFWYLVKNTGVGEETPNRIDLFDRVFNNPALLKGLNPYDPSETVPFDPARPQTWEVHGSSLVDTEIRSRLCAALQLSDDDLSAIADYQRCVTSAGKSLKTDLETLSGLYRMAGSARVAGVTVQEYLVTLRLIYNPGADCVDRPVGQRDLTIADALRQTTVAEWMKAAGINAFELAYIITGNGHGFVDPGYREADLKPLLESMATISAGARLNSNSFVFESIDAGLSETLFNYLRGKPPATKKYVSEIGIFKSDDVTFQVIAPVLPVSQDDLETDLISLAQAKTAFAGLIENNIILAETSASEGPVSETFGPKTSLDFLFEGEPQAREMRDQVRDVLNANQDAVRHSVSICSTTLDLQNQNVVGSVAGFFDTTANTIEVLIPFAAGKADLTEYLEALLTPLPKGTEVPAAVVKLIELLARILYLMRIIDLTPVEAEAVIASPEDFGVKDTSKPTLHDVQALWTFKYLTLQLNDRTNRLIAYFEMPEATAAEKAKKLVALTSLTGWPLAQVDALVSRFWPTGSGYSTTQGVARLKKVFDLSAQVGLDTRSLIWLDGFSSLPAVVDGKVDEANWKTYQSGARTTLDAIAAKFTEPDQSEVLTALQERLVEQKRDALVGYAIFKINKTVPSITKSSDLYQYLLIDIDMTSCDSISFIAQGHASLQLYLQRARLNLEPGVTVLPIAESWWSWLEGYRIWEANRKIFLYPENYIDPSLRKNATPEFNLLKDALLQENITKQHTTEVYRAYMDDFAEVAGLKVSSSYRCDVVDPVTKKSVSTLFIFARTATDPYIFYYRKVEHLEVVDDTGSRAAVTKASWGPWLKMEVSISAPWVTPVYAFGKLMLFWVDKEKTTNSIINDKQQSENHSAWTAQVKYSFLDFTGGWVQPQTCFKNAIVDFAPDVQLAESPYHVFYNPDDLFWQKPYVVHVPKGKFAGEGPFDNGEQIVVLYGGAATYLSGVAPTMGKPTKTVFPEQDRLNFEAYSTSLRNVALSKVATLPPGRVPVKASMAVDPNLSQQGLYLALFSYYPNLPQTPPAFTGAIVDRTLQIASYSGLIEADYYADSYVSPEDELLVQSAQFETDTDSSTEIGSKSARLAAEATSGITMLVNLAPANTALTTVKNQPGWFVFDNGDDVFLGSWQTEILRSIDETLVLSNIVPDLPKGIMAAYNSAYTSVPPVEPADQKYAFSRLGTHTAAELSQTLFTGGLDALLSLKSQEAKELPFSRFYADPSNPPPQVINTTTDRLDFNGAYGPYFWDIFFHSVFLIADSLKQNQQHKDAKAWYEYIFNPTALPEGGISDNNRFWRFLPFRGLTWQSLTQILTNVGQITVYNDDPFDPHAIARLRPSAYPKTIVMHYIDNLLEWGDALYRLDTRESITQATNLYVLAADLLGPRPENVGTFKTPAAMSYDDIATAYSESGTVAAATATSVTLAAGASDKNHFYNGLTITLTAGKGAGQVRTVIGYDGETRVATVARWETVPDTTSKYAFSGIPQFLIELETTPIVTAAAASGPGYGDVPFNAIDSYFCIPENEDFAAYWDKVEDRLYKIRHCMDIHGVVRQLALFEPPLDVRALVRAGATGNLAASVTSQTAQPVPAYRFSVMLEKAKNLTGGLIGMGNALLSALQQGDAEALALLKSTQEASILNLTTKVREDEVELASKQRDALQASRKAAVQRATYYEVLITAGLSAGEQTSLDKQRKAKDYNIAAGVVRSASSLGYAVPQFGSPFAMTYGGQQLGAVLQAAASALEVVANVATYEADRSLTMSTYLRRAADWQLQFDLANTDIEQIDEQLAANDLQARIAKQQLAIHEKSISQNKEMEDFLKRKFTDKELYQWLAGRLSTVFFQSYSLALDLALAAQRAYQYEYNSNDTFINFSYWDNLHKGLVAGEGLMLALHQMETSGISNASRSLEIEKTYSLLQNDPEALMALRETGECTFELSERLFDQDYPGHFARKIKTVSISLPAIVGPYQNIKATLTQTSNRTALTSEIGTVRYLLGVDQGPLPGASKLRTDWQVNQQIALSSGVDDSGLFVLDFQDPRYLPFEGTGAVSSWRLSMPKAANRIDYNALSDVIVQLRYTSSDGGEKLRGQVVKLDPVKDYSASNLYPLAQRWSSQWYAFMQDHSNTAEQVLKLPLTFPIAPPQVDVDAVGSVAFYLDVLGGASAAGNYLSVIPPGTTTELPVEIGTGNSGALSQRISNYIGEWQLVFRLKVDDEAPSITEGVAPSSITKNGFLDPAKLLNIGMTISYGGTLDWN
ncbi:MAG: neuraminidase-like domain-containing protein [Roseibium sp.]